MAGRKEVDMGPAPALNGTGDYSLESEIDDLFDDDDFTPEQDAEDEGEGDESDVDVEEGTPQSSGSALDAMLGLDEDEPAPIKDITPEEVQALFSLASGTDDPSINLRMSPKRAAQLNQVQLILRSRYKRTPGKIPVWKLVDVVMGMAMKDIQTKGARSRYFKQMLKL